MPKKNKKEELIQEVENENILKEELIQEKVNKFRILSPAVYDRFGKLCYSGEIVEEDRLVKKLIGTLLYEKHIEEWQEEVS